MRLLKSLIKPNTFLAYCSYRVDRLIGADHAMYARDKAILKCNIDLKLTICMCLRPKRGICIMTMAS